MYPVKVQGLFFKYNLQSIVKRFLKCSVLIHSLLSAYQLPGLGNAEEREVKHTPCPQGTTTI